MGPARCVGAPSSLDGYTDSFVQLAGDTMSSSSSGIAVSVSKSSRSWSPGPPSISGTRPQWCRALSMMPAESHSARAEGFGRTARAMAALRRRRAIWISCFHLRRRDMLPTNAVRCGMMRCLLHTEASECCPDKGTIVNILLPQFTDFISVMRQFTFECRLCSISPDCRCVGGGHTQLALRLLGLLLLLPWKRPHVQGRAASGDSSGCEIISRSGSCFCEPPGSRGNARV